ncbi:MAG: hypothetical protein ACKPGI_16290, partial [Verrucomicrobiota bacterium]
SSYSYDGTNWSWVSVTADNAFRLYAVPEIPLGALSGLGLAAFGLYRLRRRWTASHRQDP